MNISPKPLQPGLTTAIMNSSAGECRRPRTYGEAWAGNDLDSLPIFRSFRHA